MARTPSRADDLSRLRAVQARVRERARTDPRWAEAIRDAFPDFLALVAKTDAETRALGDRKRGLARAILAAGHLRDPACRLGAPALFVKVKGLCPKDLADRLEQHGNSSSMPKDLEQESAAAALAALDRDERYQRGGLSEDELDAMAAQYAAAKTAGTHVEYTWRVVVARPDDWHEPVDPRSLNLADLQRFAEAEYITIALYRLGGLADTDAVRPIVPEPGQTGSYGEDMIAYAFWRHRCPVRAGTPGDQYAIDPTQFPPAIAEQMLADAEDWMESHGASSGLHADGGDDNSAAVTLQAKKHGAATGRRGDETPTKSTRTEVVLWEGAPHTERNIRLARTRSAYLEATGNVNEAMAALKADGHGIGQSTFYDHLKALDDECPNWRDHLLHSGASGNPEHGVRVRPRGR